MAVHGIMETSVARAQRRRERREGQEAGFEAGAVGPSLPKGKRSGRTDGYQEGYTRRPCLMPEWAEIRGRHLFLGSAPSCACCLPLPPRLLQGPSHICWASPVCPPVPCPWLGLKPREGWWGGHLKDPGCLGTGRVQRKLPRGAGVGQPKEKGRRAEFKSSAQSI